MTNNRLILTIAIVSLGTFLFRFSFIHMYGQFTLPGWIKRSMRFVPAAVLSALIFPAIMLHQGSLFISVYNNRLVAGAMAMIVAWKTKNLLATIATGLLIFWMLLLM